MFAYRIGLPGWKIAARLGIPLKVVINVLYDKEAKVFVASSDDFLPDFGCVAESPTWGGLQKKIDYIFENAFKYILGAMAKEPTIELVLQFRN